MKRRRVRDTYDKPLWRQEARNCLTPWLGSGPVQKRVAKALELKRGSPDCLRICDLKLDRCLRHWYARRPLLHAEARLCGLGKWPYAEVLRAGEGLAVKVLATVVRAERKSQCADVEIPARLRIWGDPRSRKRIRSSPAALLLLRRTRPHSAR